MTVLYTNHYGRSFEMKVLQRIRFTTWLAAGLLALFGLAACSGNSGGDPGTAIEGYLKALVEKDSARLAQFSCADWEDDATLELESLAAVTVSLKDMSCQESGQDGETRLVSCSGSLLANYNGEDQEINLADRTYKAVEEGGDWRMCGYH